MKVKYCFLLSFLLCCSTAIAQRVQGKIIDERTGNAIPYVSIGVLGSNNSTLSNENGEFELRVSKLPVSVRFSHITYLFTEINVSDQEKINVKLTPANIVLNQIVIKPKNAENLLVAALKKAKKHIDEVSYAKAFYRQLTNVNDTASEIHELFYDVKWNPENIKGWVAKKGRFATAQENPNFTINNQSYLTFIFSGMLLPKESGKPVAPETIKNYKIRIERYIEQKNESIAVITCKLKKPTNKKISVNSTYYIGTKNLHIYRVENELINLPNNFKDVKDHKTVTPSKLNTISIFKPNGSKIPILESTATKLAISFTSAKRPYNIRVSSLLIIYQIDSSLKNQRFLSLNVGVQDKKIINSIKYDPDFWKDNPIVKRTALESTFIKMMERKQAFESIKNP